ncbi:hypothetical protein PROFUN_07826 [Planoprotostelium fungivorum]|uniref:Uncharacterized protein n=1 Tax=Planoprotostelium fungivorum TaxID=1890364 RepID=A0A2P6NL94_9EUKA|nr:hypothetical protein PROFUN_07826 [Planoprotostelium fungivorum]
MGCWTSPSANYWALEVIFPEERGSVRCVGFLPTITQLCEYRPRAAPSKCNRFHFENTLLSGKKCYCEMVLTLDSVRVLDHHGNQASVEEVQPVCPGSFTFSRASPDLFSHDTDRSVPEGGLYVSRSARTNTGVYVIETTWQGDSKRESTFDSLTESGDLLHCGDDANYSGTIVAEGFSLLIDQVCAPLDE